MKRVGPIAIVGSVMNDTVEVPLATFETPLFPSVKRGGSLTQKAGGIRVTIARECMTRSVLLQAPNADVAHRIFSTLDHDALANGVAETSRFAKLRDLHYEIVGNLVYLRVAIDSADAAGHNMATLAAQRVMESLLECHPQLSYVSVSGNACTDKKSSAINGILGRGKHVIAECTIPERLVKRYLRTTPAAIADLNVKKNLIGTMSAGGVRTGNAHYANMLLAFYLACGQDGANVVEGSQGITHATVEGADLYFSCTIPNVIVGTVGNGKDIPFVKENLQALGCLEERPPGENSRRLAAIAGATVLCGELSLMGALCHPGELMDSHQRFERKS